MMEFHTCKTAVVAIKGFTSTWYIVNVNLHETIQCPYMYSLGPINFILKREIRDSPEPVLLVTYYSCTV